MDSLWFGEGADYSREDAYWLTAVSGIPFGMPGELLQAEASVQRGMVYGVCAALRLDAPGRVESGSRLWKWWDAFDIDQGGHARILDGGVPGADRPPRGQGHRVRAQGTQRLAIAVASWARNR